MLTRKGEKYMKIFLLILFIIQVGYSLFGEFKNQKATKMLEEKIKHAKTLNDFENILYEDE